MRALGPCAIAAAILVAACAPPGARDASDVASPSAAAPATSPASARPTATPRTTAATEAWALAWTFAADPGGAWGPKPTRGFLVGMDVDRLRIYDVTSAPLAHLP